jgi:hypothetical protein
MANIRETDCVFGVFDSDNSLAIKIEPRTGGWSLHLNLKTDCVTVEEAEELARRLRAIVTSVTAQPADPFVWIEAPGSGTKQ